MEKLDYEEFYKRLDKVQLEIYCETLKHLVDHQVVIVVLTIVKRKWVLLTKYSNPLSR